MFYIHFGWAQPKAMHERMKMKIFLTWFLIICTPKLSLKKEENNRSIKWPSIVFSLKHFPFTYFSYFLSKPPDFPFSSRLQSLYRVSGGFRGLDQCEHVFHISSYVQIPFINIFHLTAINFNLFSLNFTYFTFVAQINKIFDCVCWVFLEGRKRNCNEILDLYFLYSLFLFLW